MNIELPEVSELGMKVDLLIQVIKDQTLEDLFCEILDSKEAAKYLKMPRRYLQVLKEKKEIPFSQHGQSSDTGAPTWISGWTSTGFQGHN